jgi:hypothetical protein
MPIQPATEHLSTGRDGSAYDRMEKHSIPGAYDLNSILVMKGEISYKMK